MFQLWQGWGWSLLSFVLFNFPFPFSLFPPRAAISPFWAGKLYWLTPTNSHSISHWVTHDQKKDVPVSAGRARRFRLLHRNLSLCFHTDLAEPSFYFFGDNFWVQNLCLMITKDVFFTRFSFSSNSNNTKCLLPSCLYKNTPLTAKRPHFSGKGQK